MSKQRLGKRERMARKCKQHKQGGLVVSTTCSRCSEPRMWKFGRAKASKITFNTKLVCGQCRSNEKSRTGASVVGTS